ncbi:hypothetical protein Scep_016624 [Stephania cephalantha]|uniref:Uncharacterized protein n=1 Tax=Stephania cephalantha TaxID=152367 RepID=A0AAP0IPT2_9MAGN
MFKANYNLSRLNTNSLPTGLKNYCRPSSKRNIFFIANWAPKPNHRGEEKH